VTTVLPLCYNNSICKIRELERSPMEIRSTVRARLLAKKNSIEKIQRKQDNADLEYPDA
jgi:hypothetical protein